ncbi:MAG: hypothetical protein KF744_10300 [Taibaiella sp.]|nr:hypothetical protein [Taibaiella sp.]
MKSRNAIAILLTILSGLLFPNRVPAQKKHGYNRLCISFTSQQYNEQGSIVNGNPFPGISIRARNTKGNYAALQYERTTKYGLLLSAGIHYGTRRYAIVTKQDFTNFDQDAAIALNGYTYSYKFATTVNYTGLRLLVGYRWQLHPNWAITAKAGLTEKRFFNGPWEHPIFSVDYISDNGYTNNEVSFMYAETKFGRQTIVKAIGPLQTIYFPNRLLSGQGYIGIDRSLKRSLWAKEISVGLEYDWSNYEKFQSLSIWTSPNRNNLMASKSDYIDRNMSIGLRLGIGFWK